MIKTRALKHRGHNRLPGGVHNVAFTRFVLSLSLSALFSCHLIQSCSEVKKAVPKDLVSDICNVKLSLSSLCVSVLVP